MSTFWRKKRINHYWAAIQFKNEFPELKNTSHKEVESYLENTNLEFYEEDSCITPIWIRLTLPFALIFIILSFIYLPINYLFTGKWGYRSVIVSNWIKQLGF